MQLEDYVYHAQQEQIHVLLREYQLEVVKMDITLIQHVKNVQLELLLVQQLLILQHVKLVGLNKELQQLVYNVLHLELVHVL